MQVRVLVLGAVLCVFTAGARDAATVERIAALIRAGDFTGAVESANRELAAQPKDARVLTLLGLAEERLNRNAAALASFHRAMQADAAYAPALQAAVELEYRTRGGSLEKDLQRLLVLRPEDPVAQAMAGETAWRKKDCAAAIHHFEKAGAVLARQTDGLRHYGVCLARAGQAETALGVFARVHELDAEDVGVVRAMGSLQLSRHRYAEAKVTLQPLADRSDAEAMALLAAAQEGLGETPEAVKTLRRAIVEAPDRAEFYVQFASIAMDHGSFQVGIDMLDAGLKRLPRAAELYLARGVLRVQMGRYEEADQDFAQAALLDPRQTTGFGAQALTALQANRVEEALTAARSSVKAHPDDALSWYVLSEVLVKRGAEPGSAEFREARRAAQRAVQLKPDFVAAADVLSRLLLDAGDTDAAIAECRRVLAIDSADETALYRLIRALKKRGSAQDLAEVPKLSEQLNAARHAAQARAMDASRYKLVEPSQP